MEAPHPHTRGGCRGGAPAHAGGEGGAAHPNTRGVCLAGAHQVAHLRQARPAAHCGLTSSTRISSPRFLRQIEFP